MHVLTRTIANGTEYWDNEGKKVLFVPTGEQPSFEVTESPVTMLRTDAKPVADKTVINLDGMTATQLREFAKENNIEVPSNFKKPDTIREYIKEQLAADAK